MRFIPVFTVLILCITFTTYAQNDTCPAIVQTALETTDNACSETGRNQACYGNIQIDASGRTDAFQFTQSGDIVDVTAIETISLGALDEAAGAWGIALMNVQANLPGTMPGQGVRMLAFGDVRIENAVPLVNELPVVANANSRMRSSPSTETDYNVMLAIDAGQQLIANGRTENGEWLRVRVTMFEREFTGWMAAIVLDGDSERMSLPVVEVGAPVYGPMQAFYLTTGIGESNCAELPPDGIVIQTPQGAGTVDFLVDGVRVSLGSTAFLETTGDGLVIALLEGQGVVSAAGTRQFVPPGTQTTVPLADDGRAPVDAPSFPEPYDSERLAALPVSQSAPLVPDTIAVADPVPEGEVESAIVETFAPFGGIDGVYDMVQGPVTIYVQPTYTGGFCNGAAPFVPNNVRFTEAGLETFGQVWPRIGNGVYGDPQSAHDALRTLPPAGQEIGATTFYLTSISTFTIVSSSAINNEFGNQAVCSGEIYATWIEPLLETDEP